MHERSVIHSFCRRDLSLHFETLKLEGGFGGLRKGSFCVFDSLTVSWSGGGGGGGGQAAFCGEWPRPPTDLVVPATVSHNDDTDDDDDGRGGRGRDVRIEFQTDDTEQRRGFKIRVSRKQLVWGDRGHHVVR